MGKRLIDDGELWQLQRLLEKQRRDDHVLFTRIDAARFLDVSMTMVRKLEVAGELPFQQTLRGQRLFIKGDVKALAHKRAERRAARTWRVITAAPQMRLPFGQKARPRLPKLVPTMAKAELKKAKVKVQDPAPKGVVNGGKTRRIA